MQAHPAHLDPGLLAALRAAVRPGDVVATLADGRTNLVVDVRADGVELETRRSQELGSGPQLVPAWMLQAAWDHLLDRGRLTNAELLAADGLNVKRSSAVCALLARLPGVVVASTRPIELRWEG